MIRKCTDFHLLYKFLKSIVLYMWCQKINMLPLSHNRPQRQLWVWYQLVTQTHWTLCFWLLPPSLQGLPYSSWLHLPKIEFLVVRKCDSTWWNFIFSCKSNLKYRMCFVVLLLCVKELFCINQLDMKNYHHSKYYCFFICMYYKYTIVCSVFFFSFLRKMFI